MLEFCAIIILRKRGKAVKGQRAERLSHVLND